MVRSGFKITTENTEDTETTTRIVFKIPKLFFFLARVLSFLCVLGDLCGYSFFCQTRLTDKPFG